MRKILIDKTIRDYAAKYKKIVTDSCQRINASLEDLKQNLIKYNAEEDASICKLYIEELISDYPKLLNSEPKEWPNLIKKYNKVLGNRRDILSKKLIYGTNGKFKKFYELIVDKLDYEKCRSILGNIHQEMGLKTCVYCNSRETLAHDGNVWYQMDHYLPQSEYPFLGTCFYNLQPSCSICNNYKSTKQCRFQLYINPEEKTEINPFKFQIQLKKLGNPFDTENIDIKFLGRNLQEDIESKDHESVFKITEQYSVHKDEVLEIYDRFNKIAGSQLEVLSKSLNLPDDPNIVMSYFVKKSLNEEDIHDKPLTKLTQDTIEQLKKHHLIPEIK